LAGGATIGALFGLVVLSARHEPAWKVSLAFVAAAVAFAALCFELLG
jgi:hypothetical protein